LTRKTSTSEKFEHVEAQLKFLKPILTSTSVFLEIGPGDCSLSHEAAKFSKHVYAIDVSDEITKSLEHPENFSLILSDGCSIPVPRNSVDVAYSNQLMEHLHPDDAFEQIENIYKALAPNGLYICITPNRLSGPHDISYEFDEVATGFHLKEYTVSELRTVFADAGFLKIFVFLVIRGRRIRIPVGIYVLVERILSWMPSSVRKPICHSEPLRKFFECVLIGKKSAG
jgi:SAM-dependent methyltransferase